MRGITKQTWADYPPWAILLAQMKAKILSRRWRWRFFFIYSHNTLKVQQKRSTMNDYAAKDFIFDAIVIIRLFPPIVSAAASQSLPKINKRHCSSLKSSYYNRVWRLLLISNDWHIVSTSHATVTTFHIARRIELSIASQSHNTCD